MDGLLDTEVADRYGRGVDDTADRARSGDDTTAAAESRARDEGFFDRLVVRVGEGPLSSLVTLAVVGASVMLVAAVLHPRLLLTDTLPTGGDMGAHVWSPAYLRDHLLSNWRLVGWTPDWYAGFPAFQFYMVLPSLAIVFLNGFARFAALGAGVAVVCALFAWQATDPARRRKLVIAAGVAALVALVTAVGMPYGIAFKLVAVSGLVSLPISAWALGRCAGLAFPGPALLSVASLPFLFDRSFNIYGGNIASTMAGEFAFSMSLSLSVLALGLSIRALDTGRGRGWAALVFALAGLCHIFPAVFAAAIVGFYFLLRAGRTQITSLLTVLPVAGLLGAFWALPFVAKSTYLNDMGWEKLTWFKSYLVTRNQLNPADTLRDSPPLEVVLGIAVVGIVLCIVRRNRLGVALALGVVAIALLFTHTPQMRLWNARMLPFYYLSLYLLCGLALYEGVRLVVDKVWARWFATWALTGLVIAELARYLTEESSWHVRIARVLPGAGSTAAGALFITGIATLASVRRGEARLLFAPLAGLVWMLATLVPEAWDTGSAWQQISAVVLHVASFVAAYALIGLIVVELLDMFTDTDFLASRQTGATFRWSIAPIAFVAMWIVFGMALHALPGGKVENGKYRWGLPGFELTTTDRSFLDGWAKWNFKGVEQKLPSAVSGGYPEYRSLIEMAEQVSDDHGCGRAMWEYEFERLQGYGTPMAPMLLPHFTDGCIGSMEGLYFEASSTTPFHFLNQSALSETPSSAQRDLPYPGFDIDLGVSQLQLMGVRYYIAQSAQAIQAAQGHPDLTEVGVSQNPDGSAGPWHMFLVDDSELVTPLRYSPVVYDNVDEIQDEWLQPAAVWFNDPSQYDVVRAADGPDDWPRYTVPETAKLPRNEITKEQTEAEAAGEEFEDPTLPEPERVPLQAVEVSNVAEGRDSIEFDVDQVGVPVLVKVSYFPNWKVDGADGPYRVTPNLMVVVPTDTHVELHYGSTSVDYVAYLLTAIGIVLLALLFRSRPAPPSQPWWDLLAIGHHEPRNVTTPGPTGTAGGGEGVGVAWPAPPPDAESRLPDARTGAPPGPDEQHRS